VVHGESGCLAGYAGQPAPKTVRFDPNPKSFGNRLVVVLVGASHRVFRSTLQGLNQLIVGLSPLFETTSLAMRSLMIEVDEFYV
jgi:hypothetical protein